jgi:hypothetical protein
MPRPSSHCLPPEKTAAAAMTAGALDSDAASAASSRLSPRSSSKRSSATACGPSSVMLSTIRPIVARPSG